MATNNWQTNLTAPKGANLENIMRNLFHVNQKYVSVEYVRQQKSMNGYWMEIFKDANNKLYCREIGRLSPLFDYNN